MHTRLTYRIMCGVTPEDSEAIEGEPIFTDRDAADRRLGELHNQSTDGPNPKSFWVDTIDPRD